MWLRSKTDNFERAQVDKFKVSSFYFGNFQISYFFFFNCSLFYFALRLNTDTASSQMTRNGFQSVEKV